MIGQIIGTTLGFSRKAATSAGQHFTLAQIERDNKRRRRLDDAGVVSADTLFAPEMSVVISGGASHRREELVLANISTHVASGIPVVLLCEEGSALPSNAADAIGSSRFVLASAQNPTYEPLANLSSRDAALLLCDAVNSQSNGSEISCCVEALGDILQRNNNLLYMRKMEVCPFSQLDELVDLLEQDGKISPQESVRFRNDVHISTAAQSALRLFCSNAVNQGQLLAEKPQLPQAVSVIQHVSGNNGLLCIEVPNFSCDAILSLVAADAEFALRKGMRYHVVISTSYGRVPERLLCLSQASGVSFTFDFADAVGACGSETDFLNLAGYADRFAFFQHGTGPSSEAASRLLGEYDKVDATLQRSSGGNLGLFGYGHSSGKNITTAQKRERVVKPEELAFLNWAAGEFFLCDRYSGRVVKASLENPNRGLIAGLLN